MQRGSDVSEIRQRIHLLRELPPLPIMAQRILSLSNDDADIKELADTIEKDPCLSARLLSLANAAYFGWPGGVRTIYDAIYKVLGLKMVKSLAVGLILGGVFRADRCNGFSLERYWFTAVAAAAISQRLFMHTSPRFRNHTDNIYLAGLLHNIGLPALVHLFPREMGEVFSRAGENNAGYSLNGSAEEILGVDPCRAGGWLARKWRLPPEIIHAIEYHEDCGYMGEFWPVTRIVGHSSRHAGSLFRGTQAEREPQLMNLLGISEGVEETVRQATVRYIEGMREMALLLAKNGSRNG